MASRHSSTAVPNSTRKFIVDHNAASGLMEPEKMQAARSPRRLAKRHAGDIVIIQLRKSGALHTIEPAVDPKAK
jgi:hypothetical protein